MEQEETLNWRQVWKEATRLKCERVLLLGTMLACDLLGVRLPEVLCHHARRDRVTQWLVTQVRLALFQSINNAMSRDMTTSGTFDAITPTALERFFFQLAVRKPLPSKLQFLTYLVRTNAKTWGRSA
jgi:hypothetical protein